MLRKATRDKQFAIRSSNEFGVAGLAYDSVGVLVIIRLEAPSRGAFFLLLFDLFAFVVDAMRARVFFTNRVGLYRFA